MILRYHLLLHDDADDNEVIIGVGSCMRDQEYPQLDGKGMDGGESIRQTTQIQRTHEWLWT